jgi:hypothetical protein
MPARTAYKPTNTSDATLSRIQDSVAAAINDLNTYKEDALQPAFASGAVVQARVGQVTILVGSASAVSVVLPAPSGDCAGRAAAVVRTDALKDVFVSSTPGVNVGATAADTLPKEVGLFLYRSIGFAWMRQH